MEYRKGPCDDGAGNDHDGQADHYLGFPLSTFGRTNDVQLYADRQQKSDPPLQALHKSLCRKQTERRVLQPAV